MKDNELQQENTTKGSKDHLIVKKRVSSGVENTFKRSNMGNISKFVATQASSVP